ncbi:MAG: hypothetical protein NVS3B21_33270 [Acidimicrobiales bacterium]
MVALLANGECDEAAEQFVEQVAIGPGQWSALPPTLQQTFVRNAGTFLDEANDPEALTIDLGDLAAYRGPALLTHGTASPPLFAMILDKISPAVVGGKRVAVEGAGHVPQMSHPKEYAELVLGFFSP